MAGLWSTGGGKIIFFVDDGESEQVSSPSDRTREVTTDNKRAKGIFFLPQRPYMVLGTLRQQLLYPTWSEGLLPISGNDEPTGMHLPFYIPPVHLDS